MKEKLFVNFLINELRYKGFIYMKIDDTKSFDEWDEVTQHTELFENYFNCETLLTNDLDMQDVGLLMLNLHYDIGR